MRAFLAFILVGLASSAVASPDDQCMGKVDAMGEMTCTSPPPPGTGLRKDGRGVVHLPKHGFYRFIGGVVNSTPGPRWYTGGSYGSVQKTSSAPLVWIRPDGRQEPVPTIYLYPPF